MLKSKFPKQEFFTYINSILKNTPYFISGSFANPHIAHFNDIDLFFYSENDYNTARSLLTAKAPKKLPFFGAKPDIYVEEAFNAFNARIQIGGVGITVQLINKSFGTVQEIFDTFDLSICRHAILSNGDYIDGAEGINQIITNVNYATFSRAIKYINYYSDSYNGLEDFSSKKYEKHELESMRNIIDKYIEDTTIIDNYYGKQKAQASINKILFDSFSEIKAIYPYLQKAALDKASELLI